MSELLLLVMCLLLAIIWWRLGRLQDTIAAAASGTLRYESATLESIDRRLADLQDRAKQARFLTRSEHHQELRDAGIDPHELGA